MSLLIDGYNLLYAAGIVGTQRGARGLESSRLALLNFIANTLEPAELATTTVVFDAAGVPPGLPPKLQHRGLSVSFARDYPDADAMLEDLIQANTSPRRLTVVSSDHRVQRAARRRRARAVDSEVWYQEVQRQHQARAADSKPSAPTLLASDKPTGVAGTLSSSEVEYWLRRFDQPIDPKADAPTDADNIFPPGYGEDIEDW